ncbi:MAG TPA: DUF1697 domain-containing protein [Amnibacterium sp.]|uniref:DUF1697 domain-containing protein n=1 Tax=Amnibacterium sp. TaxID=1872496 RepID=UPI002F93FDFA
MRWVVLLRGVNIGNVRIAMKELAAALAEQGFAGVRTVLASGNVLLTTEQADAAQVAADVHGAILERFGFDIAVLPVPIPSVRTAVEEYPFPRASDRHAYVVFAERTEALAELLESAGPLDPAVERVQPGEGVLYWDAPKGETLTTAFGKRFGARQRSGAVTTRNLNTLEKILAAA